jgi:hypothetical protein
MYVRACSVLFFATVTSYAVDPKGLMQEYCAGCHKWTANITATPDLLPNADRWKKVALRVHNGEMPPKGAKAPSLDARIEFVNWIETTLRQQACSAGPAIVPAPLRRLNRDEYSATIRDLLDIHMDVGSALPTDGAGGEGFDNAAETLFLSPIHAEKYMEAAKRLMDYAAKDSKARTRIIPTTDARKNLEELLPRAFRRPIQEADLAPYLKLFDVARKRGATFDDAYLYTVRGVLISPQFLFRIEQRQADDYALASRLSYFLWGTMPDELLFDIAAANKLHEPEILKEQVRRMLRHPKSLDSLQRFVEQWLRTRELGGEKAPDAKLYPMWADDEIRSDIRYQPVLFFREILVKNQSLLDLIDSNFTFATGKLAKLWNLKLQMKNSEQPQRVDLPPDSNRGGLLGMPAVLAVSSHPYRTSPVLRGAWILDALLGTPPPPPPPNVPALEEDKSGTAPKSIRERLEKHRADPTCASCHARIDPIGFALENYDVIGRWRTEDNGKPVDTAGELPDGTKINGPAELKSVLKQKSDLFIRNLTTKMLGFALGRGLTIQDGCAVDAIAAQVKADGYKAQTLMEAIALSPPFTQNR